jgi:hypothetical protein
MKPQNTQNQNFQSLEIYAPQSSNDWKFLSRAQSAGIKRRAERGGVGFRIFSPEI